MTLALTPYDFFYNNQNGDPLVGGKVYTYVGGSVDTPIATYTDSTQDTANTNPVILDANGRANIWIVEGQLYKFVIKDANDVLIKTLDNIGVPGALEDAPEVYCRVDGDVSLSIPSANQGILRNHVFTQNEGGFTYNTSSNWYALVVPSDGDYVYSVQFGIFKGAADTNLIHSSYGIIVNQSSVDSAYTYLESNLQANQYGWQTLTWAGTLKLNAGDSIRVIFVKAEDASQNPVSTANMQIVGWHLTCKKINSGVSSGGGGDIAPVSSNLSNVSSNLSSVSSNLSNVSNSLSNLSSNIDSSMLDIFTGYHYFHDADTSPVGYSGSRETALTEYNATLGYLKFDKTPIDFGLAADEEKNHPGIEFVELGSTNQLYGYRASRGNIMFGGGSVIFEAMFNLLDSSVSNAGFAFSCGLQAINYTGVTNVGQLQVQYGAMLYFYKGAAPFWQIRIASSAGSQLFVTNVVPTQYTWYYFQIVSNTAGTIFDFYLNNVLLGSLTMLAQSGSDQFPDNPALYSAGFLGGINYSPYYFTGTGFGEAGVTARFGHDFFRLRKTVSR